MQDVDVRLSTSRERELRVCAFDHKGYLGDALRDLLNEIDALRKEIAQRDDAQTPGHGMWCV